MRIFVNIFILWLAGGGLAYASETPYIWWSVGAAGRLADGRFEQILTLRVSPGTAPGELVEIPEVWLRLRTQARFNQADSVGQFSWRKCSLPSSQPWTLIIRSGEYATADVFARAETGGAPLFAQTRIILYGQGGEAEQEQEAYSEGPAWPEFALRSGGESYWPQTGHEFTLRFSGETGGSPLVVFGGSVELAAKAIQTAPPELLDTVVYSNGVYRYTVPHDPALNRAGVTAAKPLIFVARPVEGGTASCTQIVHRSRYAFWNKETGLAVLAGACMLSSVVVITARKKRKLPCA